MLSASSAGALRADADRIAGYLTEHPDRYPMVLRHLQAGRPAYRWRMAAYCPDPAAAVSWLSSAAAVLIPAGTDHQLDGTGHELDGSGDRIEGLAAAWLGGSAIRWPAGPAQPPWDFPPPAFELSDFDFPRQLPDGPTVRRLAAEHWLHQPHWARWRRAGAARPATASRLLVVLTAEPLAPEAAQALGTGHARVVRVSAGPAFAVLGADAYSVDPADPVSLARLLAELPTDGIDWVHALPLAVAGPVGAASLDRARWACLDTPAALLQAFNDRPVAGLRVWWLSGRAQPVDGAVGRPELGLLAGVCEVAPQEQAVAGCWLDLPATDPAGWAAPLAGLLAAAGPVPRRLALRQGFWWQQATVPVTAPGPTEQPPGGPVLDGGHYLVLGGTGGIGSSIAGWLLDQADCRVLLLAREPKLPPALADHADRIELVPADLATEPVATLLDRLAGRLPRLDGVVHAAGTAAGALIVRRDPAAMRRAGAAKLNGCLLVEGLIGRYRPAFAAYCSSMSALFGGVGQLDYAAGNGLLDGFAGYRSDPDEATVRLGIDWDIWSEVGMAQAAAQQALRGDARHQAHLAVGLSVAEGRQVFGQALALQLPQLLVSTTELAQAGSFYAPPAEDAARHADPARPADAHRPVEAGRSTPHPAGPVGSVAEQLSDCLCRWLGVDELDPAASLYDLGADSLVLLDLIGEIKQRFGVDIELARLSHRASLAEVLAQYHAITGTPDLAVAAEPNPAEPAAPNPARPAEAAELVRLDVWQRGTGTDLLCLIHPIGGDIQAYRSLVSLLDPGLTVCLIADPALYRPELPTWSLADRARHYAEALAARFPRADWRWRLAGWSFGAWVALAMAARAEAAGQPVAGLYLLDPPPPDSGPALQAYDEEQLRTVFELELHQNQPNGHRPETEEAAGYAERLVRCCRANLASMAGYQLPGLTETPAELWLAGQPVPGLPQHGSPDEREQAWHTLLPGLTGCHLLDTSHDGIVRLPAVQGIAAVIDAASRPAFSQS